ncbi:MAG: flavodoxin family protein [Candidatus Omnitrophica bacterium]|nr:flavodoxin family protein [Candidatus Omnitrophota bacterium]MCM8828389.1 flavodoxin family protein [Candidatus Omnitrophota bacterium]
MKILAIAGSKNPEGKTSLCVMSFFLEIAKEHQCETILLTEKKLELCRQCDFNGWGLCRTEGRCVIEDDFEKIVNRIRKADAVVFFTPVYFGDMSESIKCFLDRLRRITRHPQGKNGIYEKPTIGVCVAGGGGGGAVSCCFFMERVLATCGFSVEDMIPCRRQNLSLKSSILTSTGKWFVQQLSLENPEGRNG